ncbi:tetratricopeptide repeat protein [Motilimonas sp. E26]|uniref:SirB1 family protein n=1 Tax=Motilimonas TaxID=1914248 RepID=UPI001E2CCEC0|nr:tetratricopeptide repeat protein [Motilimonas sp. E26]
MIKLIEKDMPEVSLLDMALMIEQELGELDMAKVEAELAQLSTQLACYLADRSSARNDSSQTWQDVLACFFQQWQFSGDWQQFFDYQNTLVSQGILKRKGTPLTLGILLVHFLRQSGVTANGICFPGHFLVRIDVDNNFHYIDPFNGELLSWQQMELKLRGAKGDLARLKQQDLKPDDIKSIIKRLLHTKKGALLREHQFNQALRCSDILLRLAPGDPFEIRDRGFIFHELDCFNVAVDDFNYFIDKCPNDPSIGLLKLKIEQMDHSETVMH